MVIYIYIFACICTYTYIYIPVSAQRKPEQTLGKEAVKHNSFCKKKQIVSNSFTSVKRETGIKLNAQTGVKECGHAVQIYSRRCPNHIQSDMKNESKLDQIQVENTP